MNRPNITISNIKKSIIRNRTPHISLHNQVLTTSSVSLPLHLHRIAPFSPSILPIRSAYTTPLTHGRAKTSRASIARKKRRARRAERKKPAAAAAGNFIKRFNWSGGTSLSLSLSQPRVKYESARRDWIERVAYGHSISTYAPSAPASCFLSHERKREREFRGRREAFSWRPLAFDSRELCAPQVLMEYPRDARSACTRATLTLPATIFFRYFFDREGERGWGEGRKGEVLYMGECSFQRVIYRYSRGRERGCN